MNILSLLVPFLYLTILLGSLYTFTTLYRRRQINAALSLAPYFPTHTTRNIYLTLLHNSDTQKTPPSILMAALMERAITDVDRIRTLQTRKAPLNTLLQRGVVGDEIYQRLLRAEQELELELKDVQSEANALAQGWGNSIMQSAVEVYNNRMLRGKVEEKKGGLEGEKRRWEETREKARRELVGGEEPLPVQETKLVLDEQQAPSVAGSDDAVMVEREGSGSVTPAVQEVVAGGSGGGKKNKKKNKK